MCSLLGSAKLNGIDPEIYLEQVLERLADHPISRVHELLPWNVSLAGTAYHPLMVKCPHNIVWTLN